MRTLILDLMLLHLMVVGCCLIFYKINFRYYEGAMYMGTELLIHLAGLEIR